MRYIALKPCRISCKNYEKDNIISPEDLPAYDAQRLIRYGFINEIPYNEEAMKAIEFAKLKPIMIGVPILSLDGKVLDFSAEDVAEALRVLQMSSESAVAYIKDCQNDMVCNLLGFIDKRKGVFATLSKRSAKNDAMSSEQVEETPEKSDMDNAEQEEVENGGGE